MLAPLLRIELSVPNESVDEVRELRQLGLDSLAEEEVQVPFLNFLSFQVYLKASKIRLGLLEDKPQLDESAHGELVALLLSQSTCRF